MMVSTNQMIDYQLANQNIAWPKPVAPVSKKYLKTQANFDKITNES